MEIKFITGQKNLKKKLKYNEKRKILIFGNGPSAEVVFKILKKIEKFEFVGFIVDKKYIHKKKFLGIRFLILNT